MHLNNNKVMTNYDKAIDSILKKMNKGKTGNIYKYCRHTLRLSHNQSHRIDDEMLRRGLIERVNWWSLLRIISTKGLRINDEGGWLKVIQDKKRKLQLELELMESQISSNSRATKISRLAIVIGLGSMIVSLLTLIANFLGWI